MPRIVMWLSLPKLSATGIPRSVITAPVPIAAFVRLMPLFSLRTDVVTSSIEIELVSAAKRTSTKKITIITRIVSACPYFTQGSRMKSSSLPSHIASK